VRHDQTKRNRPQYVLDVGQRELMGFSVSRDRLFGELACVPHDPEQRDSRQKIEPLAKRAPRDRPDIVHRRYHGTPATTPSLTRTTASAAMRTANQSTDNRIPAYRPSVSTVSRPQLLCLFTGRGPD